MDIEIEKIIKKYFSQIPDKVTRMETGICNEVYKVQLKDRVIVVRMNKQHRFLKGTSKNISIFKSKGIKIPELLFEDYSEKTVPYGYQIMSFIEGQDLGMVIENLSVEQLKTIAQEISNILLKLSDLPTNGKFGWVDGEENKLVNSWYEVMEKMYSDIQTRNDQTNVVGRELVDLVGGLLSKYKNYFNSVPSQFVYDDLSSKNVIIKDGEFNGLVDLDQIMYGDPLEPIGRIKASWYGTEYGAVYTEAVIKSLNLNEDQQNMVTIYALLNRINWLSEIGIKFNENTSEEVDMDKVREGKHIIELIKLEVYKN